MTILNTILPIFLIIFLGWIFHLRGFLPREFLAPGNRLVFYMAIPAMIFQAVAKASLSTQFDVRVALTTLGAVLAVFALTWSISAFIPVDRQGQRGTFVQTAFHGNIGYIALAIAYYALGKEGLVRASILAGFVMILQNLLAVFILQYYSDNAPQKRNPGIILLKILSNPIIIAATTGFIISFLKIPIPKVIDQSLEIVGGLALPMALLIIGASLTFNLVYSRLISILSVTVIKLLILPGLGYLGYRLLGISPHDYLPALILLATPTATIAVVMAHEISGDMDFAVATVSVSTLASAATFSLWLKLSGIL